MDLDEQIRVSWKKTPQGIWHVTVAYEFDLGVVQYLLTERLHIRARATAVRLGLQWQRKALYTASSEFTILLMRYLRR